MKKIFAVVLIFGLLSLWLVIHLGTVHLTVFSAVNSQLSDEDITDVDLLRHSVEGSDGNDHDTIPKGEVPVLLPGPGYMHFRNWIFADGFNGLQSRFKTFKKTDPRIHLGTDGRYHFVGPYPSPSMK